MTSILAIEDDPSIRAALERGLAERGHTVQTAATGISGLEAVLGDRPDLVLLDLGLPGRRRPDRHRHDPRRQHGPDHRDHRGRRRPHDGAGARLRRGRLRREAVPARPGHRPHPRRDAAYQRPASPEPIRVGELVIHEPTRSATLAGEPLELARREFDLLLALAQRAGEVVSKRTLLADVWQQADGGSDRTVDVHLSWLRRKLGETAAEPRYLESVRGVGVRLVDPTRQRDLKTS